MLKKGFHLMIVALLVLQIFTIQGITAEQVHAETDVTESKLESLAFPKRGKERKELVTHKTEISNTYLNPDGTFTKETYAEPIQYKNTNGNWKNIQNDLKESKKSNFTYENESNAFKLFFDNHATMQLEEEGKKIAITLQNTEKIKPVANKNLLGYKNIFKHTDLNYNILSASVKEEADIESSKVSFAEIGILLST